jgi:hypothetical protein
LQHCLDDALVQETSDLRPLPRKWRHLDLIHLYGCFFVTNNFYSKFSHCHISIKVSIETPSPYGDEVGCGGILSCTMYWKAYHYFAVRSST